MSLAFGRAHRRRAARVNLGVGRADAAGAQDHDRKAGAVHEARDRGLAPLFVGDQGYECRAR
jgi:hypothetical protein